MAKRCHVRLRAILADRGRSAPDLLRQIISDQAAAEAMAGLAVQPNRAGRPIFLKQMRLGEPQAAMIGVAFRPPLGDDVIDDLAHA